jgi:hypothetical protein
MPDPLWTREEIDQILVKYHEHRLANHSQVLSLKEAQKVLPQDRQRRITNAMPTWFEKLYTGAIRNGKFSFNSIQIPDAPVAVETPKPKNGDHNIKWTDDEMKLVADKFIELRLSDIFVSPTMLLDLSQEALPQERRRAIAGISAVPVLQKYINELWAKRANLEIPPPQIIEIQVPQPPNYAEIMQRMDTPSLAALLLARLGQQFQGIKIEAPPAPVPAPGKEPISLIKAASAQQTKSRHPRVALVAMGTKEYSQVMLEIEKHKLEIDLRPVDLSEHKPSIPLSCDCVIFLGNALGGHVWKAAREHWPTSRLYNVAADTSVIVQKLRDILAMKLSLTH